MSLNRVAYEWLEARKVISSVAAEAGIKSSDSDRFAEVVIARLANHDPPIVLEMIDGNEEDSDAEPDHFLRGL